MAKSKIPTIRQALKKVNAEISGMHSDMGGKYACLSGEGYAGGYRDAMADVLLRMRGVRPGTRHYWDTPHA